jgi:tryptophan synthase alpha chain
MNKILMTHLYFGDPSKDFSLELAKTLVKNGADILEVGIPYSDPVCDGEAFQKACNRALINGTTPLDVFDGITKLRKSGLKTQIFITSYFGPVFKMGIEKFIKKAAEVEAQGIIIPDILLDEQVGLLKIAKKYNISIIQFATPYSPDGRLKKIISASTDFIYCVAAPNITGAKNTIDKNTITLIKKVKKLTQELNKSTPVYVGFGISTTVQIKELINAGADGVIVGSAIAKIYENYLGKPSESLPEIGSFIKTLKKATITK